jgi:hypothetical protein
VSQTSDPLWLATALLMLNVGNIDTAIIGTSRTEDLKLANP